MTGKAIQYLHYILDAIEDDFILNERLEEVANKEDITNAEYCQIYADVMTALMA